MAAAQRPVATRYGDRDVYAVAELNKGLAGWIERLPAVWVEGEVTGLRRQSAWAFAFWTLKDAGGGATIGVRMARASYDQLASPLRDGERIHLYARPEVARKTGQLSLRALRLELFGLGKLLAELERRKSALAAEGLLAADRKRPLPAFPRLIGLVTGHDAAAQHDVVEHVRRRYPPARFRVCATRVQGTGAAERIRAALATLDADAAVDVIVITRGGGSFEDLLPFSDERLCRAIAACGTPVVSAIGHEQDAPLCDFVADVRASTPTHAARVVVPDAAELLTAASAQRERARRALRARLDHERASLTQLAARPVLRRPQGFLDWRRDGLAALRLRLGRTREARLERERRAVAGLADRLRALGPAATLARGYAIALTADGRALRDAAEAPPGAVLRLRVARGRLVTRVEESSR